MPAAQSEPAEPEAFVDVVQLVRSMPTTRTMRLPLMQRMIPSLSDVVLWPEASAATEPPEPRAAAAPPAPPPPPESEEDDARSEPERPTTTVEFETETVVVELGADGVAKVSTEPQGGAKTEGESADSAESESAESESAEQTTEPETKDEEEPDAEAGSKAEPDAEPEPEDPIASLRADVNRSPGPS